MIAIIHHYFIFMIKYILFYSKLLGDTYTYRTKEKELMIIEEIVELLIRLFHT